jgi:superfamily II RNA helicase
MNMAITDESMISDYHQLRQQLENYTNDMREVITHPNYCLKFLQSGRLVKIKYKDHDFGWGAVVNFTPRKAQKGQTLSQREQYVVDVVIPIASSSSFVPQANDGLPAGIQPPAPGDRGKMEVVPVLLTCIECIGHLRVFLPQDLRSADQRGLVRKAIEEVKKRFPDGIAILDPVENMNIVDPKFKTLLLVRSEHLDLRSKLIVYRKSRALKTDFLETRCTTRHVCPISTRPTPRNWRYMIRSRTSRRRSPTPSQSYSSTSSRTANEFCDVSVSSMKLTWSSSKPVSPARSARATSSCSANFSSTAFSTSSRPNSARPA